MPESLIKIDNLKKVYTTGEVVTKVLHGISFDIKKGEFVSIMGPSGSGKSTLMHILGLLDRSSSGHYFLDDKDVIRHRLVKKIITAYKSLEVGNE